MISFSVDDELNLPTLWPSKCGERIRFLEHVQVRVNLKVWPRGDLLISLESPSGTVSHLTQHQPYDMFRGHSTNLTDWVILTLHHWGENPWGTWKLRAHLRSGFGRHRKFWFSLPYRVLFWFWDFLRIINYPELWHWGTEIWNEFCKLLLQTTDDIVNLHKG